MPPRQTLPREFAELLNSRGTRVLEGKAAASTGVLSRGGTRFVAMDDLLKPEAAAAVLATLERTLPPLLEPMEQPIPPESTWGMTENYGELLPKTAKVSTALLQSGRSRAFKAAEKAGLIALLKSKSFRRFAEVLNGRPLHPKWGIQILCYREGDYAGPHNDHHPEEAAARDGYLDVHLTFANKQVKRQLLVYEKGGHFQQVADVAKPSLITAYRLPFWHYTTPLEAKSEEARRWVLLGTFTDQRRRGRS